MPRLSVMALKAPLTLKKKHILPFVAVMSVKIEDGYLWYCWLTCYVFVKVNVNTLNVLFYSSFSTSTFYFHSTVLILWLRTGNFPSVHHLLRSDICWILHQKPFGKPTVSPFNDNADVILFTLCQACPKSGPQAKCGPWSNFDLAHGLIHKMNGIWPVASIVVKLLQLNICGAAPTDVHLTKCGLPGKNFGHPCIMQLLRGIIFYKVRQLYCQPIKFKKV